MGRIDKDRLQRRNKSIRDRYWELWESGQRRDIIIEKLSEEYFLAQRTIENIIYSKKYD